MPDTELSGAGSDIPPTQTGTPRRARTRTRRRKSGRALAALDLGTNNCRLLIAKPTQKNFRVIDSYSKVVRLGEGLATTGRLAEDNIEAAIKALNACSAKMHQHGVKQWRCVATQACRQAENGDVFLKRVKSETGINLEVISARVEARLAVMGCLNLIDTKKDVALVIDVGGGSTELSWVDVRRLREMKEARIHRPPISAWASIPLGVVTLSEQIPEVEDRETWYKDLKDLVREKIAEAGCEHRFTKMFKAGRGHLIGTSGTITTLAAAHLDLPFYQRNKVDGIWLPTRSVTAITRKMAAHSPQERAAIPVIGKDRARLLVAGCAIMEVVCEMWPSKRIRVADRGLREGILLGLMGKRQTVASTS